LAKFGPEYKFETTFSSDGVINKKTRTLTGDLILKSTGDPLLSTTDINRLVRDVVRAGIVRVTGNLIVTGPLTYATFYTTDRAIRGLNQALRRAGVKVGPTVMGGTERGTRISNN